MVRPDLCLSVLAIAVVLVAGCTSEETPETTAADTPTAVADLPFFAIQPSMFGGDFEWIDAKTEPKNVYMMGSGSYDATYHKYSIKNYEGGDSITAQDIDTLRDDALYAGQSVFEFESAEIAATKYDYHERLLIKGETELLDIPQFGDKSMGFYGGVRSYGEGKEGVVIYVLKDNYWMDFTVITKAGTDAKDKAIEVVDKVL